MKKQISLIFLFLFVNSFYCQFAEGIAVKNLDMEQLRQVLTAKTVDKKDSEIEGSVFFDKEFRTAKIKGIEESWPVRYDAYRDEIEVKKNNEIFALKKESQFENITFIEKNENVILANYDLNGEKKLGYLFKVSADPRFELYRQKRILFKKGKEPNTTLEIAIPHRFVQDKPIYFIKPNGLNQYLEIDKKGKRLVSEFPDKKKEIQKCISESNLDLTIENTVKNFSKCIFK